jgi:ferric-dicitrate binding protein FerR (iron transport regulator)
MIDRTDQADDRLAELLQRAGVRPAPSSAAADRARHEALTAWRETVELQQRQRRRTVRTAVSLLAVAAVLVLAVARLRIGDAPPVVVVDSVNGSAQVLHANDIYRTDDRGRARLRLVGGIELRLDHETEVRFHSQSALSIERGALFIDTGGARSPQPIDVRTAAGIVRDIGTRFEVRVLAEGTRVRVRDGLVELQSSGNSQVGERGIELLSTASGVSTRKISPAGDDWAWVALAAEPLHIEGRTLQQFLDWAELEGGWDITFATDALQASASSIVLHGSIDGLTPEQALQTILPTCGLDYRVNGDVVTVHDLSAGSRR